MSLREEKNYAFILPEGKIMKPEEFFALRYKPADLTEDADETLSPHITRTCLNETPSDDSEEDVRKLDPEFVVRSILQKLVKELNCKDDGKINCYDILSMSYELRIQTILKSTYQLRYLSLNQLTQNESITCFLVNLTNLLWIHALFSFGEDFHNGLHYKNWCLRQIHYNMVGYHVGDKGFVSLFDLQSRLLNYPNIFRTKALDFLKFEEDPRLHSVICQPYLFSPKLTILVPDTMNNDLDDLQDQYMRNYIIVDSQIDLLVPVPLMLQLERSSFVQRTESENHLNADGIPEKLAGLIDVLKERGFPYHDLLSKDIFIINDTKFMIKLDYTYYDIEDVEKIRKVVWKCCRFHKSLYHCLQHHATLVRSTFQDDHLSINSMCRCEDKTVVCVNNVLYKMSEMYNPMLNEYKVDINFENDGLRCLYSAISFSIGLRKKIEKYVLGVNADNDFLLMLQIVESLYMSVPTAHICGKISVCVKIYLIANEVYEKWPKWYSIFIEEPSEVLNFIVNRKNPVLADEWIMANYTLEPGHTFTLQAFGKYISFLSDLEDRAPLRKALGLLNGLSIGDVCDYVVKNFFAPNRLINLISTVIDSNIFDNTDKMRFYTLLTGLRMINVIPACEQPFYFDIAGYPLLIVEQLILNKKITQLKLVLEEATEFISSLPEYIQELESLSRDEIDQLLRDYAAKALHFRKKPAASDCLNAALLHAEIFKEGNFYPPDEVPPSKKWIPNNWVTKCMSCKKTEFSVFVRRHHCRRCGRVICDSCSLKRMKVATYRGKVRVCNQCYDFEAQYENMDDSISDNSTATDDSMKKPIYKLSPDNDMNVIIRQQAGFDSAPDIELCLSILELHTENIAVPRTLYSSADSLLKILRHRIICPANFDYNEIANIARSLLLAAKVYYTHLGETHGMRRCEELTSELDIVIHLASLKLFTSETTKPLRDIKELKLIRDKVLERQQWELALEISTKIGLECHSIWYLWGKTLLKSGEYAVARDKISRSNVKKNPALLSDLLDIIYATAERETSRSFVDLFKLNSAKSTPAVPGHLLDECLHYVTNYGTHQQQFDFYVKHDYLAEAIRIVIDAKIPTKQFVDKIFAPYMKRNDYVAVLRAMKNDDASLEIWKEYINEMSVFCKRNQLFKELYYIQLWAKDYFRAAISSTLFYSKDAVMYGQLLKREEHLNNATAHLTALLEKCEDTKKATIEQQLTCLSMQIEVTKMIASNSACATLKFTKVPTLLGNDSDKCTVICLLFDSQKDFKVAFNFTERMIDKFSLNVSKVYKKLTEHLMQKNQENSVVTLITCIQETKLNRQSVIDDVASVALTHKASPDVFLKYIADMTQKVEMCIVSGRLKSAYTLAIRINKLHFIERIMHECENTNMPGLLTICRKKVEAMKLE